MKVTPAPARAPEALTAALTVAAELPTSAGPSPFRIERLHPALDELIGPGASLETIGDRFALTEGPVWLPGDRGGYRGLYITACTHVFKLRMRTAGHVHTKQAIDAQ